MDRRNEELPTEELSRLPHSTERERPRKQRPGPEDPLERPLGHGGEGEEPAWRWARLRAGRRRGRAE